MRGCTCGCCRARLGEHYVPGLDGMFGIALVRALARLTPRQRGFLAREKGRIAESAMLKTPAARRAIAEARARARKEGIDPRTVRFTRRVHDVQRDGTPRELTDGIIYGRRKDGKLRVFDVFESKARRDLSDVAVRAGKDLGQIARDFERFKEMPIRIDGRVLQPDQVVVSRRHTRWTVFGPRDVPADPAIDLELRQRSGFNFRHQALPLTNPQLESLALGRVRRGGR